MSYATTIAKPSSVDETTPADAALNPNLVEIASAPPAGRAVNFEQYFIHDVYGHAAGFQSLSGYLVNAGRFWGVRRNAKYPGSICDTSLNDLLDSYASQIERTARAPLVIGGYSFGADLAHGVAVRLQDRGTPVAGVIMIEAFKAPGRKLHNSTLWHAIYDNLHLEFDDFARAIIGTIFPQLPATHPGIHAMTQSEVDEMQTVEMMHAEASNFLKMSRTVPEFHGTLLAVYQHAQFILETTFETFRGPGLLIRGTASQQRGFAHDNGFGGLVSDLEIHNMDVAHHAFLAKSVSGQTAKRILAFYERIGGRARHN